MTKKPKAKLDRDLESDRREIEEALQEQLESTMRKAWLPNTLAWVGVVVGSFVLNLLLLVLISGG